MQSLYFKAISKKTGFSICDISLIHEDFAFLRMQLNISYPIKNVELLK
ncbi:hypothetical protein NU08_2603 [Flavobacterium anhuiense]|uniref:Uncharacterized protein n=1 Tax=Flavobacterium anhuiense TaxID=459526 RepID=A0A444VXF0_9FLAO|nr:hypothetical protein NU08_2603 [Flavobacterium anhuiense]